MGSDEALPRPSLCLCQSVVYSDSRVVNPTILRYIDRRDEFPNTASRVKDCHQHEEGLLKLLRSEEGEGEG